LLSDIAFLAEFTTGYPSSTGGDALAAAGDAGLPIMSPGLDVTPPDSDGKRASVSGAAYGKLVSLPQMWR
jgi:hypothetical protein